MTKLFQTHRLIKDIDNKLHLLKFHCPYHESYHELPKKILSVGRIAELMGLGTSLQAESWLAEQRVERNLDEADILQARLPTPIRCSRNHY